MHHDSGAKPHQTPFWLVWQCECQKLVGTKPLARVSEKSETWLYDQNKLGRPASHLSFAIVRRFARILEPKQTWLMHLSGHEDQLGTGFGWDDATWRHNAKNACNEAGLSGSVDVPTIGQIIGSCPSCVLNSATRTSATTQTQPAHTVAA
jgi:hypothetical protein